MAKLDGFSRQFAANHPETGEIGAGMIISAEQAMALGRIFEAKIAYLSRRRNLTHQEINFLSRTAELGARNVAYLYDTYPARLSEGLAAELTSRADTWVNHARGVTSSSPDVPSAMERLARNSVQVSLSTNPYLRPNAEDFASAAVKAFGDLVDANGGQLEVDEYLAGNLQNMIAHYEKAEASRQTSARIGDLATQR